jgi:hypothetical protein
MLLKDNKYRRGVSTPVALLFVVACGLSGLLGATLQRYFTADALPENVRRKQMSVLFDKMNTRRQLPHLLDVLGLTGEGVEVGVRNGDFSKDVLMLSNMSMMHMVDPWEQQDPNKYKDISNRDSSHQDKIYNDLVDFMKKNHPNRHKFHRGYSVDKAKDFYDNSLDFVYIDARHDYEGVKEDLEAWWPKLKIGGLFAGHDFVKDGIVKEGDFGVQKAVHEFANKVGKEFLSISTKDPSGCRVEPQHVDGGWSTWYIVK